MICVVVLCCCSISYYIHRTTNFLIFFCFNHMTNIMLYHVSSLQMHGRGPSLFIYIHVLISFIYLLIIMYLFICLFIIIIIINTCHILPPSEIDLGLRLAVFAGSGGKYLLHRVG